IGGVLATVHEITDKVIAERRIGILKDLGADAFRASTAEEACLVAANVLSRHAKDVPFALLYLIDPQRGHARLAGSCGLSADEPTMATIDLSLDPWTSAWPLAAMVKDDAVHVCEDLAVRFAAVPSGPWSDRPSQAAVLQIRSNVANQLAGFLVAGASSRLRFDDRYRSFLDLVSGRIATAIANARAYEEERKRAEALAELDRSKTTFFSNVSHEFRTPLTLMLDPLVEALRDPVSSSDPSHRERLEFAYRNSRRLLKLVNSLLDFSRIEGGRIDASYEPTDLATVTAELAGVFRSAMEQARLALHVDCPSLSDRVFVDRDMWEKIVLNLLSNAFKFTFEGGVTVSMREEMAPSHHVVLEVRDTGTGIPQDQLGRVFERFHRVQGARGRTIEGTGIGLALVKQLVHLHGGTIDAASEPNRGSVFSVKIPFGTAHLPEDHLRASRLLAPTATRADVFVEEALRWLPSDVTPDTGVAEPRGARREPSDSAVRSRILVVDDNADMRGYVGRLLGEYYEVETVHSGRIALDRVKVHPPDLVLTDVMMPDVDGFALLRELRSRRETKTLPIILLSARAGEESRIEGLERGADDYLIKPFSAKELLARVAAHLEIARVRRHTEEALLHQNKQFKTLLEQAPLGVYLVDADFRIAQINPVALQVFGHIPELIGRDLEEVLHLVWEKAYADELITIFRKTLETGEPYAAAEHIERRLDRELTESYEWRIDRIVLNDGRFGVVCYFRDVSMYVLAREALQKSEERLRELAGQLEELVGERTQELVQSQDRLRALATELNLAEQRERKRLAAELHDHLQQMLVLCKLKLGQGMRMPHAAPRAVEIMRQTDDVLAEALEYTRTLVADLSPPVLHEHGLAAGLIWLANQMKRHDLKVTIRVPEAEISLPEDQAVLLFQSVRELLINASKHARSSEAHVVLVRDDASLRIEVTDNGVGFDAAAPPADAGQGTLSSKFGLFSIRERMKALGGTFELRSFKGKGTTATLSLPVPESGHTSARQYELPLAIRPSPLLDPPAGDSMPGDQAPIRSPRHRIRVLLVDDHAMVREGLRSMLESYDDVEVVGEAANGEEALTLVEQLRPTLVVMDINMPKMNGIEATARITNTYPEIVVIGLSVNASSNNVQAMLKAGALLLLTKEAAVNELYRRMREALVMHVGSGSASH
ncbi:MAG TPA: response regulator, partial [Nitrospira sp.]|nr:response regulator [Nitrospira sp.]